MREAIWLMTAAVTGAGMMPTGAMAQTVSAPVSPAAPAPAQEEGNSDEPDIIVTGSRNLPGSVVGDIPPEIQLGPADIRSYGVNAIADLLTELAPQTGSGRGSGGQPVVLLGGKRISGFQEIRDLPTEAIARVDILPEEVALKYGYRADQRVVNIVLRRRFRAATLEASDTIPTEGGRNTARGELDLLNIARDTRANLHLSYTGNSALTEAERDVIAPGNTASIAGNVLGSGAVIAGVPAAAATGAVGLGAFLGTGQTATDQTPFRTLLSSGNAFGANATIARPVLGVNATFNARLDATSSTSLNGLPSVSLAVPQGNPFSPFPGAVTVARALDGDFAPLAQRNSSITAHLGTTANGAVGTWNWSLTGSYDRVDSQTFTETGVDAATYQARLNAGDPLANPFGRLTAADIGAAPGNRAKSASSAAEVDALLFGRLLALPAGDVSTSIRVGAETGDLDSRSFRGGLTTTGQVSRDIVDGQVNVDVPLTSRTRDFLGVIGQLSVNFNLAADELSDFGTLTTLGYGINWAPVTGVRIIASATDQDEAPSAAQLGNPLVTTPNVRVFDYVRGVTATVTTLSGGNPGLVADNRHARKVGLTLKPWSATDLTLTADYTENRIDDPIAAFPTPTAAIEAAFPDRFARDAAGQLIRLDSRPINFARSDRSQLRWGFNFSKPIRSAIQRQIEAFRAGTGPNPFAGLRPPGGARGAGGPPGEGGPRAGGGPGGGRGGFGGGRGGQGGGRVQFALYHTWHFTDRVLVADGGPALDLLNGDAISGNGGSSRHQMEAQAGYSNNGIGVRLSGDYRSATRVNGGTAAVPTTLNFGDLATADLRVFADLGQRLDLVRAHPFVQGMRLSLSVDNLFNQRQRVTDASGATPIGFQPAYLDALGRTVRVSIRKLLF